MQIFLQSSRRLYFLFTFAILSYIHPVLAQESWRSAGTLINNHSYRINVEFLTPSHGCDYGIPSHFRYRIIRLAQKKSTFIYWRFDYLNCDNELIVKDVKIHLDAGSQSGISDDSTFVFSGYKVISDPYDVLASERSLTRQAVKPISPYSVEPKQISGESIIEKGGQITLTLTGGYLAPGAHWRWYEGTCSGHFIDTGRSISVKPIQNATYYVRAEGRNITACVAFPVKVVIKNQAATRIIGRDLVCNNEKNIQLSVVGGRLGDGGKWVWYENDCDGQKIGEGATISISPAITTTYTVRSEGPTNITSCLSHIVRVTTASNAPTSVAGPEAITRGDPLVLSVSGRALTEGTRWVWYSGSPNALQLAGTGSSITSYPQQTTTYYIRAEGLCNVTGFAIKTVKVKSPRALKTPATFFINAGIVAHDLNKTNMPNYFFTLGGGGRHFGAYVRAKINIDKAKASYRTDGDGHIDGYDRPGYYYQYNVQSASKRKAYTGGIYLGGKYIAFYLGGGYGQRELLAGIDNYSYESNYNITSSWVKNARYSYIGWEAESGLLVRASWFNLMGGVSSLQGKYTDCHLGIGLIF